MTNLYYIENIGCDDTTHGLARMTDEQFAVFKRVVENLNKNSTYGCMPTIAVYKISDSFIRQAADNDISEDILYIDDSKYTLLDSIYTWSLDSGYALKEGAKKVI